VRADPGASGDAAHHAGGHAGTSWPGGSRVSVRAGGGERAGRRVREQAGKTAGRHRSGEWARGQHGLR
jgi:hypothetical protein